jgi:hypothetical protein
MAPMDIAKCAHTNCDALKLNFVFQVELLQHYVQVVEI